MLMMAMSINDVVVYYDYDYDVGKNDDYDYVVYHDDFSVNSV